ncbi:unnamed protein product [Owenia fusiformis]|uniref:Mitochondrial glutamate carrier 2 n=1 Tax=Owenia fusiformis TaxID=6347 RepID=A0A8J1TE58_OWEFU|nr:unnamed protein product [Owenia fusiformis]
MADTQFSLVPKVINGGIAGIVGVTCVFPIDLVKTRLQNQQPGPNGQLMYKNFRDCLVQTFKKEKFFGMYRGSGVNLLLITPEKAIKLVGNDFFRYHLKQEGKKLSLTREMIAGSSAGACQIIVTTPMELLKIQLQDAGRTATVEGSKAAAVKPPKISATSIAMQLIKEKGITGIYKGCAATALRDITFSAIYFPLFAHLNSLGKRKEGSHEAVFYVSFISGLAAGCVASFSVNPLDVVKTRLQTLTKGSSDKTYTSWMHCFRSTLKHEGVLAFFKGAGCRIMVIAPLFGIAQTVYYVGIAEYILGIKK